MKICSVVVILIALASLAFGQGRNEFVRYSEPVIALTNVRVIDGTGSPAVETQTIVITNGKITAVGPASSVTVPNGAKTVDLNGYTVLPGLVGMHDHLFFPMGGNPPIYSTMGISFPRL